MTPNLQITIDCASPDRLVRFWCAALGYVPAPPPSGHPTWRSYYLSLGVPEEELGDGDSCDRAVDPDGAGPALWFQVVPELKTVKNRLHLDLLVTDRSAPWAERRAELVAVRDRLVSLGGDVRLDIPESEDEHLACGLHDPEGNEFCLV
ncbi:VOC family protein [Luteipulveratus sp. YIM 133132]|uniref:VOC family protein n=1 Tax=Luteipulveratus flavus TaxID=3031728 RepID=UPI0023B06F19|nr:VOC family protein [Luteipulveratus sp. YIM 133132]MDE9365597.1 VOC family protein [Luteipulveratus sp. YIM 133132]